MSEASIWFWQRIVTPHMANLAEAIAHMGYDVVYVANQSLSKDREAMGWVATEFRRATLHIAPDVSAVRALARSAPADSVHICQGLRGNGLVGVAQGVLGGRGIRQWVVMETVDDAGYKGLLKRFLYRWLFWNWRSRIQGCLAIGHETVDWLVLRGMPRHKLFAFAYFLSDSISHVERKRAEGSVFRFLFVGQLVECKRVDWLLTALSELGDEAFELVIVGDGPMRQKWEMQARSSLPNRVRWLGRLPMDDIPRHMADADCLVLPSRHDGWGAVVSEALMVGTPVICSDACGSAGVVRSSGVGGVFLKEERHALSDLLREVLARGVLTNPERIELKDWASSLGSESGARYLIEITRFASVGGYCPKPCWSRVESQ